MSDKSSVLLTVKRLSLIVLGAVIMAFNINTFVHAGGLLPGGFTGLTLLIQEICLHYGGFHIPFSLVLYTLNIIPAIVCFISIGKKFALYSGFMVVLSGLLIDVTADMLSGIMQSPDPILADPLLSSIFGGIILAVAIMLCLHAGATSGGTDFIAIYISEKYRKDAWNYIFAGNCVILAIAGWLFSLDKALYSIIFQFTTTVTLNSLYRAYKQKTLLIVTNKPYEIYKIIRDMTNHTATTFHGTGLHNGEERILLYSVVYSNEVDKLISAIRKVDPASFINVIKTEQINGQFYRRAKD